MQAVYTLGMTKRTNKLQSSVRRIIAPILRECPLECGIVTITEIDVSSDLAYATIHVSSLQRPEAAIAFLEERRSALQKSMGQLETHRTPQLRFRLDRRAEEGSRIEKLLG